MVRMGPLVIVVALVSGCVGFPSTTDPANSTTTSPTPHGSTTVTPTNATSPTPTPLTTPEPWDPRPNPAVRRCDIVNPANTSWEARLCPDASITLMGNASCRGKNATALVAWSQSYGGPGDYGVAASALSPDGRLLVAYWQQETWGGPGAREYYLGLFYNSTLISNEIAADVADHFFSCRQGFNATLLWASHSTLPATAVANITNAIETNLTKAPQFSTGSCIDGGGMRFTAVTKTGMITVSTIACADKPPELEAFEKVWEAALGERRPG